MEEVKIRNATKEDVPAIVEMLANDVLGSQREDFQIPLPEKYYKAFEKLRRNPIHELIVAEGQQGNIIGTLQISFLQYLTYRGSIRAQFEAVRVHEAYRGQGIGQQLFEWAIARAKKKGAHVIQLTTDKQRPEAKKFYEGLGFKASHEGMKLHL